MSLAYLPFRPIKGQAFRLYFETPGTSNLATVPNPCPAYVSFSSLTFRISKDGAAATTLTNAPVEYGTGKGYVDLTSTEMNADTISISCNQQSNSNTTNGTNCAVSIIIYTTSSELSSAPTLNSSIADKITALFQYFFFKRTMTASAETLYKDDESTTLASNTVSDNGTTVTKGKIS